MAPMITSEERALREAVSPFLCEELLIIGLDGKLSKKEYLLCDHAVYLRDYQWDTCNIYRDSDPLYLQACKVTVRKRLPAFTMADMMALLPPFMLTKNDESDYELCLDAAYIEVPMQRDRRAPDVFARLVIEMLNRHILSPAMCNQTLSK